MRCVVVASACALVLGAAAAGARPQDPGAGAVLSDWVSIGPDGGAVMAMAAHPLNPDRLTVIVPGYPSQVFRSANGGASWSRLAFVADYLYGLAVSPADPERLYANSSGKLHRSGDGGLTWTASSIGSGRVAVGPAAADPATADIVYLGGYVYDAGARQCAPAVFKTANGGQSWTEARLGPLANYGDVSSLVVSPSSPATLYASTYVSSAAIAYRVYKSVDAGANWQDITGSLGTSVRVEDLVVDPADARKVYAGSVWGIYRSADGGATWMKNSGYAYANALALDRAQPATLYAGYVQCVYRSTDGGVNWQRFTGAAGTARAMVAHGGKAWYGGTAGVYRSLDAGAAWQAGNAGMRAANIASLAVARSSPNIVYAEVAADGFYKSGDYGQSWTRCPDFERCDAITRIAVSSSDARDLFILAGG